MGYAQWYVKFIGEISEPYSDNYVEETSLDSTKKLFFRPMIMSYFIKSFPIPKGFSLCKIWFVIKVLAQLLFKAKTRIKFMAWWKIKTLYNVLWLNPTNLATRDYFVTFLKTLQNNFSLPVWFGKSCRCCLCLYTTNADIISI